MVSIDIQTTMKLPNEKKDYEKKTHRILEKIREHLMSKNFKNSFRVSNRDFIRNSLISFPILIIFILNYIRKSLQAELNAFTKLIELPKISKQTFSAARAKLLPEAFVELNNKLIQEYYHDNEFKKFQGFRLLIADGTTLQLPESDSIRDKYGACSNQISSSNMSMAKASHVYDPLNALTLHAVIKPYVCSEREMLFDHIVNIQPSNSAEDLYILDRGYPSIILIFFLNLHKKNFVIRCNTAWLSVVQAVLKSGNNDEIVEIKPRMLKGEYRKEFQKIFPGVCLKTSLKIRVLIIVLSTGEKEILITSLLDKEKYNHKIFKELYHSRWGVEENYKLYKVRLEIENFSGKTTHAVEQDFHASVFSANIRALIAQEAQEEIEQLHHEKGLKYEYKINKNISLSILKDEIVEALLDSNRDLKEFCEGIKAEMKSSIIPIRPGRQFPHVSKRGSRKYPMNMRRTL